MNDAVRESNSSGGSSSCVPFCVGSRDYDVGHIHRRLKSGRPPANASTGLNARLSILFRATSNKAAAEVLRRHTDTFPLPRLSAGPSHPGEERSILREKSAPIIYAKIRDVYPRTKLRLRATH